MRSTAAKQDACQIVARISGGMSGAELASVCNEGALLAGRRSAEVSHATSYSSSCSSESLFIRRTWHLLEKGKISRIVLHTQMSSDVYAILA